LYGKLLIKNSVTESYLENADLDLIQRGVWILLIHDLFLEFRKKRENLFWTHESIFGLSSKHAFPEISFYAHRHAQTIFEKTKVKLPGKYHMD